MKMKSNSVELFLPPHLTYWYLKIWFSHPRKREQHFLDRSFGFLTCYTPAETEQPFHSNLLDFSTRREFEVKIFKRRVKLGAQLEELNK